MSPRPVVLCILDGVGWGRRDEGDAVWLARTPNLDRLMAVHPWCLLDAHGTAVGMPSDADMGNSEVGHNAMGAGRVFDQGAKLVDAAISSGRIWQSPAWRHAAHAARSGGTLHLLGLVSDGNVHSHVLHLLALVAHAAHEGIPRLRVHVITDGRDVAGRSALTWVEPLEATLAALPGDYAVGSGGGRMHITMDRYEADWGMVARGWATHVHGTGRRFPTAAEAIRAAYIEAPDADDQWLPAFVVGDYAGMDDGDATILFNFRGDRAIEISRAFDEGPEFDSACFDRSGPDGRPRPAVHYAGMMQYDGDLHIPAAYLVAPPAIDRTVGQFLAEAGIRVLALAETQKFGHVTYFFNGNRSGALPGETQIEEPSDRIQFDRAPAMKAREVTDEVCKALRSHRYDHVRLNLANGDMVGHTGKLPAAVEAMEVVDECVGRIALATAEAGGVLLVTADHGNADEMFQLNKKRDGYAIDEQGRISPSTSHSLNPVPFVLVDSSGTWLMAPSEPGATAGSIARIGATLLTLCGLKAPADYLPSLVRQH